MNIRFWILAILLGIIFSFPLIAQPIIDIQTIQTQITHSEITRISSNSSSVFDQNIEISSASSNNFESLRRDAVFSVEQMVSSQFLAFDSTKRSA